MRFKTLILTACLLAATATAAHAGPIRDRLSARFARPCQPAPATTPGPVRQAVGTVLTGAGGVVADLGQAVQGDGYTPIRLATPLSTRPVCGPSGCPR